MRVEVVRNFWNITEISNEFISFLSASRMFFFNAVILFMILSLRTVLYFQKQSPGDVL